MSSLDAAIYNEARLARIAAAAVGGWTTSVFSSRTITFTQTGKLAISRVGSGGGGAVAAGISQSSATGGNSGPWGRKVIDISSGDVLVVNIGAGGLKSASPQANGNQGGTSTVTLNGVTILTIQGGEGGVFADLTATASAPVPAATITGADFWVAGVQAGSAQCTSGTSPSCSGGAAVDILQSGLGKAVVGQGFPVGKQGAAQIGRKKCDFVDQALRGSGIGADEGGELACGFFALRQSGQ